MSGQSGMRPRCCGLARTGAVVRGALLDVTGRSAAPAAGGPPPVPGTTGTEAATPAGLERFFGNGLSFSDRGAFGLDRAQLITTPDAPGGSMLRVGYPAGSASRRAAAEDGGMQAYLRLPDGPEDALHLQYFVRFQPDFDFVRGGKLPGLFGGTVTGGQHIPDGTDGFSTRYMWRSGGDGEVYAYLPTSQEHGTSLGRGCWSFPTNQWVVIEQRVALNTPGASDGEVSVWQDGRHVLHQRGLTFRTTDQLKIDGVFFSTFFGGGDATWATPVDQHADFAGFSVSADPTPRTEPGDDADNCQATCIPAPS